MNVQAPLHQLRSAKRILVVGSPGSGKTTVTRQLASILNIEALHLDAYFWQPGWIPTPQEEWRDVVRKLVRQELWIMDGTYESTLDLRMPAADMVLILERSRLACLWHVIRRKMTVEDNARPDAPAGQRLDWSFFRYIWNYPHVTRPFVSQCVDEHGHNERCLVLRGRKEIQRFLARLQTPPDNS